jgi:predicted outer membrane protein
MKKVLLALVILGVGFCWTDLMVAQVTTQQQPNVRTGQSDLDRQLATCLAIDNRAEIQIAQFAEGRAQRSEVKEFAKKLQNDHNEFLQRLSQISPMVNAVPGTQPGAVAGQTTTRPAGHDESKMMAIKQEVANTCVKAIQEELSNKSDNEFDRCFVGSQVGAHMHMLAMLQVFERHASPSLAPVIRDGITTVEEHLQRGKQLLKGLESELAQAESDRPTSR